MTKKNQMKHRKKSRRKRKKADDLLPENAGSDQHNDSNNETGEDELNWKKQVLIAAVYGLCANPACIAYAPAIPDIAMMIANKLENFGVTSDERLPDF
ncbi:Exodeoxyribonuclease VIII (putative partial) from phage origin [Escherichia coli]|nr:Exodeoxyribonuclease VIII (putative partial) from phage origin [Escherichia coli]